MDFENRGMRTRSSVSLHSPNDPFLCAHDFIASHSCRIIKEKHGFFVSLRLAGSELT